MIEEELDKQSFMASIIVEEESKSEDSNMKFVAEIDNGVML